VPAGLPLDDFSQSICMMDFTSAQTVKSNLQKEKISLDSPLHLGYIATGGIANKSKSKVSICPRKERTYRIRGRSTSAYRKKFTGAYASGPQN